MATTQELQKFHSEDYVSFLSRVSPDAGRTVANNLQKFNVGEYTDCPIFDGMMEFCKLYTGCSIGECVFPTARHRAVQRGSQLSCGVAGGRATVFSRTHKRDRPNLNPTYPHETKNRWGAEAEPQGDRRGHQLVGWAAPRQEERGLGLLLHQRHRAGHPR